MKKILVFIALIICSKSIIGQEITIYGQESLWHADNLCDIEYTGCDWRTPNKGYLLGYAYHPNGSLWLVLNEQLPPNYNYSRINIFDVEIENCRYSLLYTINLPKFWNCSNAANIDYLGRLYLNINEYDTITHKYLHTLSRITNPAQPLIERVFTFLPNQGGIFEVHFQNERVYIPSLHKPNIYVFDTSFVIHDTIIMQKHIWGLTSFDYGCDSIKTYATHMGISTEEYNASHPDTMMYISEYDLETNTLTPVCSYWMGDHVANTQLTSPLEFLSSDPECDLLIDLDRDNSTGVYPYDYIDSTIYCTKVQTSVCDDDIYIHASAPLDSIRLILSGILDPGFEHLIMPVVPPGVTFTEINDSTYVIIAPGGSDMLYRDAMLALRFEHNGLQRTAGERQVILQGYNTIKDGVIITARLQIGSLPYAGEDVMLMICSDTVIQNFSTLTQGQPAGYWWPLLMTGNNIYDGTKDVQMQYHYIVQDPVCGNDTAIVTVVRDTAAPVDILGADLVLCPGDSIDLEAGQGGTNFKWDDGSIAVLRTVTTSGLYWVEVSTNGGCKFRDTVRIAAGEILQPIIKTINPTCGKTNGRIEIDSSDFVQGSGFMLNNVPMTIHYKDNLTEGQYNITSISKDGCTTHTDVNLISEPVISIDGDTIVTIKQFAWQIINYSELNNVSISEIIFNPDISIRLNGSSIEAYGDQERTYDITFIDDNGCIDVHKVTTRIEKAHGIYLPNIFSPRSTSGNDTWNVELSSDYQLELLRIYDRWGNVVQDSKLEARWDGTFDGVVCNPGVYVYQLIVVRIADNERIMMKGDLTLIR
ncbi:MAG TPA: T9SS type B sorting domain-containing protein [Saprospiraceae bacterium]|nr:T9SS type B sorting domain-containing protein [Saprospiraceae bacterium]